jgi:hypothetical protein
MAQNGELKDFRAKPSGRPSIVTGAKKYCRGFIIRPEQIVQLFHDTQPGIPLPKDAVHRGIGVKDEGVDSEIQFYFTSESNPTVTCFAMKPEKFFKMLVELADGLLPLDSELDGIEVSANFTVIMLRVGSSHWPAPLTAEIPLYHLRYDLGRLILVDPLKALEPERKIVIQ